MKKFEELFEDDTKNVQRVASNEYLENGNIAIVDQGKKLVVGYTDNENYKICKEKRIIFGDHTRIFKYVDIPFITGADGTKVLKLIDSKNNDYKYFYYYLQHSYIPNTGYNRHYKWVKELMFNVPGLEEQKEIAKKLDMVQEIINTKQNQLDELDNLIKSQFVEMFGDPEKNEKNWGVGLIRDLISDIKYGTSRPAVENGRYKYLRMNNITYEGKLDLTDIKYIDVPENEIEKCVAKRGDILFNRTNSRDLVGKTCVYNNDESMIIAGFVIRARVNKKANPYFISEYMNTKYMKNKLKSMCKNACGQSNINSNEFQNIRIYIPPIELQNQFAYFVEHIDKLEFELKKSLEETQNLFDSLMAEYFE